MIEPVAGVLRALAFLSRFPAVPAAFRGGPHPLAADAPAFPVCGLVIGLLPATMLPLTASAGLGPMVAATIAVGAMAALTGALHEDGLGDTADGLFGHAARDRALEIMKDSRIGTYGVLALMLSVFLKIALLAEIGGQTPFAAAAALLAAAAASRGAMGLLWSSLPTARPDGVADRLGQPSLRHGWQSISLGCALGAAFGIAAAGLVGTLAAILLSAIAYLWFRSVVQRRLGGQTGDTLGACQQMVEIAILMGLALGSG